MKERSRLTHRVSAPIRSLAHRFAFLGLVIAAFGLMLLSKADVVMMERFRSQVTDTVAPILDVMSRPVATANEVIAEVRALGAVAEENRRLRSDKERLLQWQFVARKLEAEGRGFGMDAVAAPDAGRCLVFLGPALQDLEQGIYVVEQDIAGLGQLDGETGIKHIR